MATVNPALGLVNTSTLGFTVSHEHVIISAAGMRQTYRKLYDRQEVIEHAVAALKWPITSRLLKNRVRDRVQSIKSLTLGPRGGKWGVGTGFWASAATSVRSSGDAGHG